MDISFTIVGLRDRRGRFAAARDGVVVAEAMAGAEAITLQLQEIYRVKAPRSQHSSSGHAHFADSISFHAVRTMTGFELAGSTSKPDLRKWIRDGTAPHEIRPRVASVLSFDVGGEHVFARLVHHPGTRPNTWEHEARAAAIPVVNFMGNRIGVRVVKFLGGGISAYEAA